ncbi:MAG: FAD-binding oxidoreductase [Saprospiraceae bacterium]|nr:FAD-binding oxidoreductase [Saprospiraceae bacterium]
MRTDTTTLANWGNYPVATAHVHTPADADELPGFVQQQAHILARGNGRCYGDAALADDVLNMLPLNRILDFDAASGQIRCEAGVLLSDIIQVAVPQGWFFHVTPGIKQITLGGAIACDVHGKNHPSKGCFSRWLTSFVLLNGSGERVLCTKTVNADLFWQTCGGMGWTGIVLEATLQLMPVSSVMMRQTAVRAPHLEAVFRAFAENEQSSYAAGWVDCLSTGAAFGRGVVFLAEHETAADPEMPLVYPEKKVKNVPFFAPSWILNPLSIRLHNQIIFSRADVGERLVDMDAYFYPLDRVRNWNRLYGRRGLVQYQFCLPEKHAFDGIRRALETIRAGADTPFLTVLKRHGVRPAEAVHSFPVHGYSLALDFPRTRSVFDLVRRLDDLVWSLEGKIYLAKDACSRPVMGRVDPNGFGENKFCSLLKMRLLNSSYEYSRRTS